MDGKFVLMDRCDRNLQISSPRRNSAPCNQEYTLHSLAYLCGIRWTQELIDEKPLAGPRLFLANAAH
jgi:hypothetical protein